MFKYFIIYHLKADCMCMHSSTEVYNYIQIFTGIQVTIRTVFIYLNLTDPNSCNELCNDYCLLYLKYVDNKLQFFFHVKAHIEESSLLYLFDFYSTFMPNRQVS